MQFDANWRFHLGDAAEARQPAYDDSGWREIRLPHDYSAEQPFDPENGASGTGYLPGGIGWYRKAFVLPAGETNRLTSITFDGVYRNSTVWLNGTRLGDRPYGYATFSYDLTPHLVPPGHTNLLAVRVERENVADSRWYPGSGIYRHVWLTRTHLVHVPPWGVFITTPEIQPDQATIQVAAQVRNASGDDANIEVETDLVAADGRAVASLRNRLSLPAGAATDAVHRIRIPDPALWSPEHPVLYRAVSRIHAGDRVLDEVTTPFGIRSIRFDADQGFFLNDQPTLIKGVCLHHDAGAVGAAVPEDMLARRFRLLKDLGCNALRASHNPMAPEWYALADRMGFLVMDEAFDEWTGGKRKWVQGWNTGSAERFGYHVHFAEWAERDLEAMVRRDRNHPSIILWSIGNEIDYPGDPFHHPTDDNYDPNGLKAETLVPVARRLAAIVRALDPTRPVTAAASNIRASNDTGFADELDVVGYNYQESQYPADHARYPQRIITGSENSHGIDAWLAVRDLPYVSSQFLWTGFNYLGEAGRFPNRGSSAGLFDTAGFLTYRGMIREALWADRPVLHLLTRAAARGPDGRRDRRGIASHWNFPVSGSVAVTAISNCDAVELTLNGRPLGPGAPADQEGISRRWDIPFEPGILRAVGARDGQPVETVLATAGEPATLTAVTDRESLPADGQAVVHVEIQLADDQGKPIRHQEATIRASVSGAARLLALDNGNQSDVTPLHAHERATAQGRLLAVVQAGTKPGDAVLTLSSSGIEPREIRFPIGEPDK
jgi:beta-galactosidase